MKKNINPYVEKANLWPKKLINDTGEGLNQEKIDDLYDKFNDFDEIYLELGSGSGQFIIEKAKKHPKKLYIGVEIRFKRSVRTIEKAERDKIQNLLILRTDYNNLLEQFKPACFSGVYINFPDPWDKKRWHKHRLFRKEIIDKLSRILKADAFISFKSDHAKYFHFAQNILDEHPDFQVVEINHDLHQSEHNQANIKSEFEQLFQSKQKNIYYLKAKRLY